MPLGAGVQTPATAGQRIEPETTPLLAHSCGALARTELSVKTNGGYLPFRQVAKSGPLNRFRLRNPSAGISRQAQKSRNNPDILPGKTGSGREELPA